MIRNAVRLNYLASIAAAASLGACSGSQELQTSGTPSLAPTQAAAQTAPAARAYQLNEKELKLSCKALTGAMKVRILQIRSTTTTESGTVVARTMQTGATKVFGGPSYGTNPQYDGDRDMAQLHAYNQQLATKKCKTLDLQAELQGPAPVAASQQPSKL